MSDENAQYIVTKNHDTGGWTIFNRKHPSVVNLDVNDTVPPESYVYLTEGQFIALVRQATEDGYIGPVDGDGEINIQPVVNEETLNSLRDELAAARQERDAALAELAQHKQMSESGVLKQDAMKAVLKIVGLSSIEEI